MKIYDLTVQFSDKKQSETKSFYTKKAANKALQIARNNQNVYNYTITDYAITTREATKTEIEILNNHKKLTKEMEI